ncbi:hypothetical protein JCM5353_005271 [Sporobolomyces roseus]
MSSSPPPSFLTPSPNDLNQIYRTLSNREQARRILSQRSLQSGTSNSTATVHEEPFGVTVGSSRDNMGNNRYGDIIAYDSSRILIPSTSTSNSTSETTSSEFYVNASLILEPDLGFSPQDLPRRYWVAAQGPTTPTIPSFLSLLLHSPCSPSHPDPNLSPIQLIIQLTPLIEQNREKCAPYFPSDREGEEWIWETEDREDGGVGTVWVRYEGRIEGERGERRSRLRVGNEEGEEGREVIHVEYLGWRDHGVPEDPSHLVSFINRMNALNLSLSSSSSSSSPSPILLHCSAGVGRTGTYLTISSLLPLLKLYVSNPSLTPSPTTKEERHPIGEGYPHRGDFVGMTVDKVRDQRTTMVQTKDQLGFVYQALQTAWEEKLY